MGKYLLGAPIRTGVKEVDYRTVLFPYPFFRTRWTQTEQPQKFVYGGKHYYGSMISIGDSATNGSSMETIRQLMEEAERKFGSQLELIPAEKVKPTGEDPLKQVITNG
jgi:hypothetical protein